MRNYTDLDLAKRITEQFLENTNAPEFKRQNTGEVKPTTWESVKIFGYLLMRAFNEKAEILACSHSIPVIRRVCDEDRLCAALSDEAKNSYAVMVFRKLQADDMADLCQTAAEKKAAEFRKSISPS